ncbi:MAG TPA: hypothetical protein VGE97_10385 [Nitrososphaera sp.]|jgi:hypothetical protein
MMNTELFEWNAQDRRAGEIKRSIEFNSELGIKRPITEVFQVLSNLESMRRCNYFVFNGSKISDGQGGINTVFFGQKRKTDSQEYKTVEYELNKMVALGYQLGGVKLAKGFLPSPSCNDNDFIPVNEWKFDNGTPSLFASIDTSNVNAALDENMEKTKQLFEIGKTILQDRREERN